MHVLRQQKSMQNCRPPSFFLTNTTALHHILWLGLIASPAGGSEPLYPMAGESVTFILCSVEWVQPNSVGSNENTLWYLTRSQWAASAGSGGQESNPLKSSSLNIFPCLYLTVNLGVWGSWGLTPPQATELL